MNSCNTTNSRTKSVDYGAATIDNLRMTNKISWAPEAKKKKDTLVAADSKLRNFFAATEESLKNGEIRLRNQGTVEIEVTFTNYKLILDIESDRTAKVKYIDLVDVKKS